MYPLPCCFPNFLYFHELFLMFLGSLDTNLGAALLLLVTLLTCGMMALKTKSGRGAGGEGAAPQGVRRI